MFTHILTLTLTNYVGLFATYHPMLRKCRIQSAINKLFENYRYPLETFFGCNVVIRIAWRKAGQHFVHKVREFGCLDTVVPKGGW